MKLVNLGLIINYWYIDKKMREELKDKELFPGVTYQEFIEGKKKRRGDEKISCQ